MSTKQSDYLNNLLAKDEGEQSPAPAAEDRARRPSTLLGRETALSRIASGDVRQVTQHTVDPARCRIWPGNARLYAALTEDACRDLLDSMVAENGQKVPALGRRVEGDPDHDFEVIFGTRRHWSVSWLRAHNYPDMKFILQVQSLDDESAFRLADLENRTRQDVSDIERARNYAWALGAHYGGTQARMAERLKLSKGWLSKMLKVAELPDSVVGAYAHLGDLQLKPAYPLAVAMEDAAAAKLITIEAARIAEEQAKKARGGRTGPPRVGRDAPAARGHPGARGARRLHSRKAQGAPCRYSLVQQPPGRNPQASCRLRGRNGRCDRGGSAPLGAAGEAGKRASSGEVSPGKIDRQLAYPGEFPRGNFVPSRPALPMFPRGNSG